ncbi:MAG: OsmC family protein [Pseudomonadota bacterium]
MSTPTPKTTVKLRARAHAPSHSRADIQLRDLTFAIDEPAERGGTNAGPTPTETALAALIGCTNVIGHKCADVLGIDIGHLDISAVCDFDRRGVTLKDNIDVPFQKIILSVEADGPATQSELDQLSEEVAKYCPLSKLFRQAGTLVEETWKPKSV